METTVLVFGQLADITKAEKLSFKNISNTDELVTKLENQFPQFATASYTIAVNKKVINENTQLQQDSTVAFLPPFSGG